MEGDYYVVDMGETKQFENKSVTLQISGLIDSSKFTVHPRCSCTATDTKIVDKNTVQTTLNYNDCDRTFSKVVELRYAGQNRKIIKLRGECQ